MTHNQTNSPVSEEQQLKIKKLEIYAGIAKWLISGAVVAIVSAALNYQIQKSQIEIEKQKAEGSYLSQFVSHALEKDIEKRIQFAQYFAILTVDEELKNNWDVYYEGLVKEKEKNEKKVDDLRNKIAGLEAGLQNNKENIADILKFQGEVARITAQTYSEPKITTVPNIVGLSVEKARLLIAKAGLRLTKLSEVRIRTETGSVAYQRPAAGTTVPLGSMVELLIREK